MSDDARTYKVDNPLMRGKDIERSQIEWRKEFARMGIDYPLEADGVFGVGTRSAVASLCTAQGILHHVAMKHGVTPELRSKLRDRDRLTPAERKRMQGPKAVAYRRNLRQRFEGGGVCSPIARILDDRNGYRRGAHDGVDLICSAHAPALAICEATVVRVSDDWWGIGNPGGRTGDRGDGIVIIRSRVNIGPIKKGMNFGYGHAERPRVRVGEVVKAGERIADAGFANAWHLHYMVNVGEGTRGTGDRDPMPFVRYAKRHG